MNERFEAGSGFTSNDLYLLVAGVGCVLILLCAAWIWSSAYKGFTKSRVDGDTFGLAVVRAVLLILLFFWLFLSR